MKRLPFAICALLIVCCVTSLAFHLKTITVTVFSIPAREQTTPEIVPPYSLSGSININTADEALLCTVPGIGTATARALIDEREANGFFAYPEDILQVRGIGIKTLRRIQSYLFIHKGD